VTDIFLPYLSSKLLVLVSKLQHNLLFIYSLLKKSK